MKWSTNFVSAQFLQKSSTQHLLSKRRSGEKNNQNFQNFKSSKPPHRGSCFDFLVTPNFWFDKFNCLHVYVIENLFSIHPYIMHILLIFSWPMFSFIKAENLREYTFHSFIHSFIQLKKWLITILMRSIGIQFLIDTHLRRLGITKINQKEVSVWLCTSLQFNQISLTDYLSGLQG